MAAHRSPFPHQQRALDHLDSWWRSRASDDQHGFIVMPTGSGKTYTVSRFIADKVIKHSNILWVAHNWTLLDQAIETLYVEFAQQGIRNKPIARTRGDGEGSDAAAMFASIQMLDRGDGLNRILENNTVGLAVFDEFHHLSADSWKHVVLKIKQKGVRVLGLSATPFRTNPGDNNSLRKIFPSRIFGVGTQELIKSKHLAQPKILRLRTSDRLPVSLDEVERKNFLQFHRLADSVLKKIALQSGRDQEIVKHYLQHQALYGKTLVFCCNIDHAEAVAALFRKHGVKAQSVCGSASDQTNKHNLERFKTSDLEVLTSVVLLTEGVDIPSCQTVFLARPTESPILLSQMIGRAMRGPLSGGNSTCNVVDVVDNFERGLDFSATVMAMARECDPSIRRFLTSPPRPRHRGISIALLVRLREYFNRRLAEDDVSPVKIWTEEIVGWIERWDGEVHRVLLIPHVNGAEVIKAFEEVRDAALSRSTRSVEGGLDLARKIYFKHDLLRHNVPEEDFVSVAARVQLSPDSGPPAFHSLRDIETDVEKRAEAREALKELTNTVESEPDLSLDFGPLVRAMNLAFSRFDAK